MENKTCECYSGKNIKRRKALLMIYCPVHGEIDTEETFGDKLRKERGNT
jgi:hypothetical protein